MRINLRNLILASAALVLLTGGSRQAQANGIITGQLYVADYGKSVLDRYQYTFDVTAGAITSITPNGIGGSTTDAYFLGGPASPIKEGVEGTTNDLIVVVGPHGSTQTTLQRFTQSGSYIGTIPVDFTPFNNGNIGIGNVAITADGKYEYAPLETANAIVKIDLTNGSIVASYGFSGAHDVAIAANGDVYAADYNGATPKVIRLDSNLVYKQDLITSVPPGVTEGFHPTGLTVAPDGSLYVQNNDKTLSGNDSVLHYTFSNTAGTLIPNFDSAKSYIGSLANNGLQFTFGNNLGPDGNLYIAALGGGGSGSFGIQNGYIDGIYKFDTSNENVSQFILGYTETSGPVGASGLSAPKYLQFDTNFVNAPDAGVPEPGTYMLLLSGFAGICVLKRAGRRNS